MENQKINLNVENGVKELVITNGIPKPVSGFREPTTVKGCIDVVATHLKHPSSWFVTKDEEGNSPLEFSFVEINRESRSICLSEDKGMSWTSMYKGVLELDENLKKFQINTGVSYTTSELSEFIKMNRSWFETKDKAMALVSELRNFKAKVDKDIEDKDDRRGNKTVLIAQAVEHNIPDAFKLNVPIFKNYPKQLIEVEVNINASDFSCTLISPELNDFIVERKNEIIDEQKEEIIKLFPNLRVFEV